MKRRFFSFSNLALAGTVLLFSVIVACNGTDNKSGKDSSGVSSATAGTGANTLLGAGSSFVYPLFSKLFAEYNKETGVRINYQSIGSGGGILQLTNKTIDF